MLKNDAAAYIAGLTSEENKESSQATNVHLITGTVEETSEDGRALVSIDGMVFSEDDSQYIEMDTIGGLEEGDTTTILLTGDPGHAMNPLAIGSVGGIDRIVHRVTEVYTRVEANEASIENLEATTATVENLEAATARIGVIENDYLKTADMDAEQARVGRLLADKADITDLNAATARIGTIESDYLKAADMTAEQARVGRLLADKADVTDLSAATARIDDLEADHVSVEDFEAEQANIDNLQAATADIATIRANSAKVTNLTAAELEADHATVGNLSSTYATIDSLDAAEGRIGTLETENTNVKGRLTAAEGNITTLNASKANVGDLTSATGRITDLESTRVRTSDLEANYITADTIESTYTKTDFSNADVAWIQNGVIKDGSISSAMINSVSANKLTAGTINGSVINVTNLNADNITAGTINGQRIGEGSLSLDKLSEDVYTEAEVDAKLSTMQSQIDGAIETWTGTAVPTLQNSPASSWNTTALKDSHVGDVYFVVNSQSQQNGYNYRFTKSGSTYSWQLIKDSDVTNALQRISTAEGKITTFDSDISQLKTDTGTLTTKTTSLETRMSNAEADILDKVDTTTFNEVSDTVDSHTRSISQMSTTLSNKADSSTVSAVTQRVSKNEQDISGINTTIGALQTTVESKADSSTVETVSNRLNTVSNTVDGHTQSISSINSTLATKADSSTVSTLTTKVNNVSDTVDGHTQTISGQSTILSNNGLTSSTNITSRVSSVEQDLSGYKTTVSETYATQTALATTNGNVTAAQTAADNAQAAADRANGRQVAYSATSSTGASTAAKVAACANFPTLAAGATVTVRFSAANTSTGAVTLNVNSTGAKTVYVNGAATSSSNQLLWGANANITFTYDGSYWRVDSEPRTWYGTGSVAAATAAKTATINEVVICKGTTVVLNMTYENTSASATLNVTSTGAKNIYYGTTTTRPTTANGYGWGAGSTVSLTFDGQYWRISDTTALSRLTAAESTISSHTTSIEQNASAIALKADSSTTYTKTDVDGLISTEVTNRNAAITAKANEINSSVSETYATKTAVNGKADASDVTALAGRVTTAESNITQNANNIALKVSESDVTGNYLVGKINLNSTTASIAASHINLQGAVTISDLAADASNALTDAAKTATNYITADSNGIKIHMSGNSTTYQHQTASGTTYYVNGLKRSVVSGDGLKVYVGDTAGSETEVASFGETATIGKSGETHIELDYHSLRMVDKEGEEYFEVEDLRDESGYATLADAFVGDGIETRFVLQYFAAFGTSVLVTVNDIEQSEGTDYELSGSRMAIIFNSAPSGQIVVQYKTQTSGAKAFTFGERLTPLVGGQSVVIGTGSDATGCGSKAIGDGCLARGASAIALGNSTQAFGFCSHAQNNGTIAGYDNQTVIGKFNANNPDNAFEIGNGTDYLDNALSNAFIVDWNGNIMASGMAGMVQMFAGSTAPTGWLICNGAAVSRTTYATLFAVIGTTWGAGDGSTTFNLPDLRGRGPIGAGAGSSLTSRTLGGKGGSEYIQAHTHSFTQPTISVKYAACVASGSQNSPRYTGTSTTTALATASGGAVGAVSGASTGTSGNMQPFAVINFIICTGKTS